MKQYERKRANAWLTVYQLCLHWALRLRRTSVSKCKTAQHGGAEERTTIQFGQPLSQGHSCSCHESISHPKRFQAHALPVVDCKNDPKNKNDNQEQNLENMTEWDRNYDRTLKYTEYTLRVATFATFRYPTETYWDVFLEASEAPVRRQWGNWVLHESHSLTHQIFPTCVLINKYQQISTDFIRIFGNLWNAVACHFKLRLRQGVGLFAPEHPEHLNWSSASGWIICICVIGTGEVFPETISRSKHMPDFCSKTTYLPTGSLMPLYTFSEAPVPQCGENMTTWLWVLYRASAHTQQRGPSQNKHGSWEGPTSFLMFIQQKEIACKASKCSLLRQSNTKQL